MESTRKLAIASWALIVAYMFANGFVKVLIGPLLSDILALFLALAGLLLAAISLMRMGKVGRKGILGHAIAGLLVNLLVLAIWIPNFLNARERARVGRAEGIGYSRAAVHAIT